MLKLVSSVRLMTMPSAVALVAMFGRNDCAVPQPDGPAPFLTEQPSPALPPSLLIFLLFFRKAWVCLCIRGFFFRMGGSVRLLRGRRAASSVPGLSPSAHPRLRSG